MSLWNRIRLVAMFALIAVWMFVIYRMTVTEHLNFAVFLLAPFTFLIMTLFPASSDFPHDLEGEHTDEE